MTCSPCASKAFYWSFSSSSIVVSWVDTTECWSLKACSIKLFIDWLVWWNAVDVCFLNPLLLFVTSCWPLSQVALKASNWLVLVALYLLVYFVSSRLHPLTSLMIFHDHIVCASISGKSLMWIWQGACFRFEGMSTGWIFSFFLLIQGVRFDSLNILSIVDQ